MVEEKYFNRESEDKTKSRLFAALYLFISVCISLLAAGLYGRMFRLDAIYQQPGDPYLTDYVIEGLHVYFIMDFIILAGSTVFLFYKKKKISFCLFWVLFNVIIAIIGLLVFAGIETGIMD